jgi:hypothetical protein
MKRLFARALGGTSRSDPDWNVGGDRRCGTRPGHPTSSGLTFTLMFEGQTMSFPNTASRPNKTGSVTCSIDATQNNPDGSTRTISGTVTGWMS